MNILLLGGGGREHALAWKIAQSKHCSAFIHRPGNAGTTAFGTNLPIGPDRFSGGRQGLSGKSDRNGGCRSEEPLVKGIVDYFAVGCFDQSYSGDRTLGICGPARRQQGIFKTIHA